MPTLESSRFPRPQDPREFERMTLSAISIKLGDSNFQLNGRPGQHQNGVDIRNIFPHFEGTVVQCKNTTQTLTERLINIEIESAKEYTAPITKLFFATTLSTDITLQDKILEISMRSQRENRFPIGILFWEDIISELVKNLDSLYSFYPQFNPQRSHDLETLAQFYQILPYDGSIDFIKNGRFLFGPFSHEALFELEIFSSRCDDPRLRFIDERLEHKKVQLKYSIENFLNKIGKHFTNNYENNLLTFHNYAERNAREVAEKELNDLASTIVYWHGNLFDPRD